MKITTLKKIALSCLIITASIWCSPESAHAQNSIVAEGKTTYVFNPASGQTKLSFSRLANYTYSNQKIHVALALSTRPYSGGVFRPNFAKYVGELPARTYSNPFTVSGIGSYPKSGTYYVTVGIGVSNSQGGVTLVSYLRGTKKVTFGRKASRKGKKARSSIGARSSGHAVTDSSLTVSLD